MLTVGLTGNLGSGKTTVLKALQARGAKVFSADQCVHRLYRNKQSSVYRQVALLFPQSLSKNKVISRKKLARIVFSSPNELKKLESIIHPAVIKQFLAWLKQAKLKNQICLAEIPLLFEKKLQGYFDYIVLVKLNKKTQIKRLGEIYGFSQAQARRRLSFYGPLREKIKGSDFVIDNSSNIKKLHKEVDLLWKKLKEK